MTEPKLKRPKIEFMKFQITSLIHYEVITFNFLENFNDRNNL